MYSVTEVIRTNIHFVSLTLNFDCCRSIPCRNFCKMHRWPAVPPWTALTLSVLLRYLYLSDLSLLFVLQTIDKICLQLLNLPSML